MFLLIDNYDSFTYNLVQYFQMLGHDPVVLHNDDPRILDLATDPALERVVISPGPSHPANAGLCLEFLKRLPHTVPVLGVCLGHEVLALFAGAPVEVGPVIMHGMQSEIVHDGQGLYDGLPNPLKVGRYHSLVAVSETPESTPAFTVTARGPLGEVMSLAYVDRPWVGVQFHPESVLTPDGMRLLANFPERIMTRGDSAMEATKTEAKEEFKFSKIMDLVADGKDLAPADAEAAFDALMDGRLSPVQAGAFLTALRAKGETPLEMDCAVRACLSRAIKVGEVPADAIDIVGTGGDGRHSFNCSTTAALHLAGAGYHVIKHGNRAVSSTSGAADAIESLGIPLEKDADKVLEHVKETNFGFFFAPYAHPAFANVGPVRRELGVRTLFNLLGPMLNPARPPYLVMGIGRPEWFDLVSETLKRSTMKRIAIVHGAGGYDEVTAMGPAKILIIENGESTPLEFDPAKYGFKPCSVQDLAVESREEATAVLKDLLRGKGSRPMLDMVILNAALALYVLDPSKGLDACVEEARKIVESGSGARFVNDVA